MTPSLPTLACGDETEGKGTTAVIPTHRGEYFSLDDVKEATPTGCQSCNDFKLFSEDASERNKHYRPVRSERRAGQFQTTA